EVKPDPKPETKPEEKPEVKPDPKPETKPEEKPETKPETKPEVPAGLDASLANEKLVYYPEALKNPIVQKQVSSEAQSIIKDINSTYSTSLKYKEIGGSIDLLDSNMYLPEGSIGAQFSVVGSSGDFKIYFLDNNKATVELAKQWTTLLSGLNLDKEIQETVDARKINNYEKGNYKIRIGQSMADHTMYVDVHSK
ncbi:hypothetical protein IGS_05378, partial [Bacillus cereus IS845/00]